MATCVGSTFGEQSDFLAGKIENHNAEVRRSRKGEADERG